MKVWKVLSRNFFVYYKYEYLFIVWSISHQFCKLIPAKALKLQIADLKFISDIGYQLLVFVVQNILKILFVVAMKEVTEFASLRLDNISCVIVAQLVLKGLFLSSADAIMPISFFAPGFVWILFRYLGAEKLLLFLKVIFE